MKSLWSMARQPRLAGLTLAAVAAVAWWAVAQGSPRPLFELVPAGALLSVEARDLSGLLRDWDRSPEKQAWLTSANYEVFSRSRLLLRLTDAQGEFAKTAGVSPDKLLLDNVAGGESVLAMYDIGRLEFLYITRLEAARATQSLLWKSKGNFQTRSVAGTEYYIKEDPILRRTAVFAAAKDLLFVGTREDALVAALALLAGEQRPAMKDEPWYAAAIKASTGTRELRLVTNFEKLARTPQFRSYWVQENVEDLREFSASIADLERSSSEFRENRVLLRANPAADLTAAEQAAAPLAAMIPASAGLYRMWAAPNVELAVAEIDRKLFAPRQAAAPARNKTAPDVNLGESNVGTENDLEVMVNETQPVSAADDHNAPLRALLSANSPTALLQVQATRQGQDNVFHGIQTALAVRASSNWDAAAVRNALTASIGRIWTTSSLGADWTRRNVGGREIYELAGLSPLFLSVANDTLVLSNSADFLGQVLASRGQAQAVSYAAGYRHSIEMPRFERIFRILEQPPAAPAGQEQDPEERAPAFFSGNVASLGRVLNRVNAATIVSHDRGASVQQIVTYQWK